MNEHRIRELAPGLYAERIATSTHIDYSPKTGAMEVTFGAPEFLIMGDEVTNMTGPTEFLRVALADIATECFATDEADPVTGVALDKVSVAGVALIIKRAYATLYNRSKEPAPPVQEPEA